MLNTDNLFCKHFSEYIRLIRFVRKSMRHRQHNLHFSMVCYVMFQRPAGPAKVQIPPALPSYSKTLRGMNNKKISDNVNKITIFTANILLLFHLLLFLFFATLCTVPSLWYWWYWWYWWHHWMKSEATTTVTVTTFKTSTLNNSCRSQETGQFCLLSYVSQISSFELLT